MVLPLPATELIRGTHAPQVLDQFVYGLIGERRARIAQAEGQGRRTSAPVDLLDLLLTAEIAPDPAKLESRSPLASKAASDSRLPDKSLVGGDREPLTAGEVRDEAMTLILAGHETSALALTWCLHFLSAPGNTPFDL